MQRLTLCVIAKDEERFLAECLDSVRGLVNATVVVDTGSTDRTAQIARERGALVVQHAWNEDFAAARNAALEHVRGGFVLVLDADERLGPGARRAIRKALSRDDFDCGMLPLHDASSLDAKHEDVVAGRARRGDPVLLPRLLRRTADLRWEGVVHEQVGAWARGKRIAAIEAPVVHLGAVPELREARGKNERNLRLLEKRAAAEPDSPTVLAYLARELERCGQSQRALDVVRASWSAMQRAAGAGRPPCDAVQPVTLLAFLCIRGGQLDEAIAALAQARVWSDAHPNLDLLDGLAHERRALRAQALEDFAADLDAARNCYEALSAHRGKAFWSEVLPGALGAVGQTRLGTARLLLGESELAAGAFEQALRSDSGSLEARLGLVEARIDAGRAQDALPDLPELLTSDCADAWLLASAAALALGSREDAQLFVQRAAQALQRRPWIADFRLGRLRELLAELGGAQQDATASAEVREQRRATVVIPAYNRLDLLRTVLDAFQGQTDAPEFELLFVDDGSQPPAREVFEARPRPESWRLITRESNGGRGAALNTGLAAARGDIVIFCDSDIEPSPRLVADHLAFHALDTSELATHLGALEYGVDAGLFGTWMGARSNPRLRGGERRVDWTQWFTDNWSFKRSLLSSRGLRFDECFRAWGWEELDLAHRLEQLGATNTLTEAARGRHLKAASFAGMLASFERSAPNLVQLASKLPDDSHVRGWMDSADCPAQSVERVVECAQILWSRLEELHAAAPATMKDVRAYEVDACALACSDLVFRVGLTRGLSKLPGAGADPQARLRSETLVVKTLQTALRKAIALETRLGAAAPMSDWRARIKQLLPTPALAAA